MQAQGAESSGCVIEVPGVPLKEREALQQRLYKVLASCNCWTLRYRRSGQRAAEYSFEVDLDAVLELYCGLAQAGLEMTESSHRMLTELCVLRSHERALRGTPLLTPHAVGVRLAMTFVDPDEEIAVPGIETASA